VLELELQTDVELLHEQHEELQLEPRTQQEPDLLMYLGMEHVWEVVLQPEW